MDDIQVRIDFPLQVINEFKKNVSTVSSIITEAVEIAASKHEEEAIVEIPLRYAFTVNKMVHGMNTAGFMVSIKKREKDFLLIVNFKNLKEFLFGEG